MTPHDDLDFSNKEDKRNLCTKCGGYKYICLECEEGIYDDEKKINKQRREFMEFIKQYIDDFSKETNEFTIPLDDWEDFKKKYSEAK